MTQRRKAAASVRSRLLVGAMVTAVATTTACSGGPGAQEPSQSPTTARPVPSSDLNVLVVVIDDGTDIACRDFDRFMPQTSRLLRDQGTCFENATASAPTCAPSRAALMTSQMGHNSGAPRQEDARKVDARHTVQYALTQAGYDTYGTGKYLNGISSEDVESGKVETGFMASDFWGSSKPYGYALWDDETQSEYVPDDGVHATTRTGDFLRSFIASERDSERPFYAYAAFKAPHTDNSATSLNTRMPVATPANRDRAVPPFHYDPERDTRDKLPVFRKRLASRSYYQRLYTARTRAQYDIDDEMGKTIQALSDEGELDHTAIFYTSDQGYHLGENGWETKGDPYPSTTDVPLLAWLPSRFRAGYVDHRAFGVIDIGPTIYDLTGVAPNHRIDGHSMLSRFRRTGTYSEVVNETARLNYPKAAYAPGRIPTWSMYRTKRFAYVEFYDKRGRRLRSEFYRDADMKKNLLWPGYAAQRPSRQVLALARKKLARGRTCSGTFEQRTPNPCP
ncbi:sulfatase-like hydrolase/transferase [Nocardioides rubriscoriae]|uniref:sulfatase-like hydrolase/transferase n=1 Tax=Nocardioides rubriscoriae TaxID=642762 RepID=UPI0011E02C1B|nr:sulfatase-like hydrolase/transferase [Nocardioides rubriscoriae]